MNELKKALLNAKSDKDWPKLTKDKSGQYPFASLPHMLTIFTPILKTHGLVITFEPIVEGNNEIQILILCHVESGNEIKAASLIRQGKNDKDWGGSKTYQRRYLLMDILGIAAENDYDPDTTFKPLTAEQMTTIQTTIKSFGTSAMPCLKALLAYGNIGDLKEIHYDDYDAVLKFITNWKP